MSGQGAEKGHSHELHRFMEQVSDEIGAEYGRIVARAKEDPGTAGDEGEENWAAVLRGWLPAAYHVVTRGRLVATSGQASPQVDVLVLRPSYPPALRDKKVYLASGVAAVFECKLTLHPGHIAKAVDTAAELRRLLPSRTGTPYRELHTPLTYGLLAHSHSWKAAGSEPIQNVTRNLWAADNAHVRHPREMLDVLCVADLAAWWSHRMTVALSLVSPRDETAATTQTPPGSATTSYIGPAEHGSRVGNPVGVMIATLLQRLGWEDPSVRSIADYWRLAGLWGAGAGDTRRWDPTAIYSPAVWPRAVVDDLISGEPWDEWSAGF